MSSAAPRTAFERAAGWRGLPALFQTAATVIFAPWVFARQIGPRSSMSHAVSFLSVCLSITFLSLPFMQETYVYELDFLLAWLVAAIVYILLQSGIFCLIDPVGWNRPREALRFWLVASCYTSAIMMTEFRYGPPRLRFDAILRMLRGEGTFRQVAPLDAASALMAAQLLLWAVAPAACYVVRLRRARVAARWAWPAGALVAVGSVAFYAIVFQHVGERLYYWLKIDGDIG